MKKKTRGNGEGTIYYSESKKCWVGQVTTSSTNGIKRKTVYGKKREDVKNKIILIQNDLCLNKFVDKSSVSLIQILKKIEKDKLDSNLIKENSYIRNMNTLDTIEKAHFSTIPMQQVTSEDIQKFLNQYTNYSQSSIDKLFQEIKMGFEKAIEFDILVKNPTKQVIIPISKKNKKEIVAFEIYEQIDLINYITSNSLVTDYKSLYESDTIKNLILLALFTGMRIGEIGALTISDIDFENQFISVNKTLTKDINGNITLGDSTKTGKSKRQQGKTDKRMLPFSVFDTETVTDILQNQLQIAQSNSNNSKELLFCKNNGDYIYHAEINNIFKRICREAKIKLDLVTGCHFHMLRHTFATRCIEARLELLTIANLLGHSSTKQIEKTYGHILDKFRNEQLEYLQSYYQKENIIILNKYKKLKKA